MDACRKWSKWRLSVAFLDISGQGEGLHICKGVGEAGCERENGRLPPTWPGFVSICRKGSP